MYGEEVDHVKYPEEVRFPQCFLAFCMDREETEDEAKNYVTWGVRKQSHWEHLKWARCAYADGMGRDGMGSGRDGTD